MIGEGRHVCRRIRIVVSAAAAEYRVDILEGEERDTLAIIGEGRQPCFNLLRDEPCVGGSNESDPRGERRRTLWRQSHVAQEHERRTLNANDGEMRCGMA